MGMPFDKKCGKYASEIPVIVEAASAAHQDIEEYTRQHFAVTESGPDANSFTCTTCQGA